MEKIKVDLYVKGSILIDNSILHLNGNGNSYFGALISENDSRYDFDNAIIIEGDLKSKSMTLKGKDKVILAKKGIVTQCSE